MLFNTVFGFIIPWFFGLLMHKKNPKIILLMAPFSAVISYLINTTGSVLGFWKLHPFHLDPFSHLPVNLGLFPVFGCLIIYIFEKYKPNPFMLLPVAPLLTTFLEYLGRYGGKVVYGNGWSMLYTYFSYLVACCAVYWYYIFLKKKQLI